MTLVALRVGLSGYRGGGGGLQTGFMGTDDRKTLTHTSHGIILYGVGFYIVMVGVGGIINIL